MYRYIAARVGQSALLLLLVVSLSFLFIRLAPGDPVTYLYGSQQLSAEVLRSIRHEWGLDRPLWEQYWAYVRNVGRGNLGYSQINQQSVTALLLAIVPNTLLLMAPSILVASVLGVLFGIAAARRVNRWGDYAIAAVSLVSYSTPPFWLGIIFIVIFASHLRWLPTQGMTTLGGEYQGLAFALDVLRHLALPSAVLVWWYLAAFARLTRASMLEESVKPYLVTARMKGLPEHQVVYRHALRNAAKPILTMLGLYLGTMLAGAVLTEVVFAWPGMGRLLFTAIIQHDYPVVLGVFMLVGTLVVLTNLAVDLLYLVVDPRIRYV
jgi:peptide/nickel transport system permease protein